MKQLSEKNGKALARDLVCIFLGSTLTTIATAWIYDPAGLVTGGVSGLAIILKRITAGLLGQGIPLWLSNLLLNIPIFLFALKMQGLKRILKTGLAWLVMTAELYFLPTPVSLSDNLLLVSVYGGVVGGLGAGLLLSAHATSGGTDLLGTSLHRLRTFGAFSMGQIIQVLDGIIVLLGLLVYGLENTLYAIIAVYITGKLTDAVISRGQSAKIAFIISSKSEEIAGDIMTQMERGVTGIQGKGMYTGCGRTILVCICRGRDIVDMKEIVHRYDPKAFFVISSASEAMGEGFMENWD